MYRVRVSSVEGLEQLVIISPPWVCRGSRRVPSLGIKVSENFDQTRCGQHTFMVGGCCNRAGDSDRTGA
jgi:hypothetical protein